MPKVCFYYQAFDRDVSSGTVHALYQWHELCFGLGVSELAVINQTDDPIVPINESLPVSEFDTLESFCDLNPNHLFVEVGGPDHREVHVPEDTWLVFGGAAGLPRADLSLPINTALYPREAAAIVLENQWRFNSKA